MRFTSIIALLAFDGLVQSKFNQGAINAFNRYNPRRNQPRATVPPPVKEREDFKFLTNKTEKFAVNGTGIPEVNFDVGESYAGLLPISQAHNETRQLYFWFFPSTQDQPTDEVLIWCVVNTTL
jgi:carboxypeptidase D